MSLPTDAKERKDIPIATGVIDYFPDAMVEVARVSKAGNDQHNPGQPLHWAREKSQDHVNCIIRHLIERGTIDTDGVRHSGKLAWRALALLQTEIEAARAGVSVEEWNRRLREDASDVAEARRRLADGGPRMSLDDVKAMIQAPTPPKSYIELLRNAWAGHEA